MTKFMVLITSTILLGMFFLGGQMFVTDTFNENNVSMGNWSFVNKTVEASSQFKEQGNSIVAQGTDGEVTDTGDSGISVIGVLRSIINFFSFLTIITSIVSATTGFLTQYFPGLNMIYGFISNYFYMIFFVIFFYLIWGRSPNNA